MAIPYNPSSFNSNKTILQAIEELKKYLQENPCYKIYMYNDNYVDGTYVYDKTGVDDPDSIEAYDVIFFANSYYSKVESVGDSAITVWPAINFTGAEGPQGPAGADGADGADGVSITNVAVDGSNHLICTLSDGTSIDAGAISAPVYAVEVSSLSATLTQDEVSILEHDNSLLLFTQAGLTQVYTKYKEDSTVIRFISPNTDTSKYYYLSGVQLTKSTGVLSSYFINFNVRSGIVNSETATNGQVLTADGSGGASWETVGGGIDVVEISSISGTLSDSDFAKLSSNNTIIKYTVSNVFLYKTNDTSTTYQYSCVQYFESNKYARIYTIIITKSTKEYEYSSTYKYVPSSSINSQSATNGQVLTADGSGGATWQNASGGSLYLHSFLLLSSSSYQIVLNVISTANTSISTLSDLQTFLFNIGNGVDIVFVANGYKTTDGYIINSLRLNNTGNYISIIGYNINGDSQVNVGQLSASGLTVLQYITQIM